MTAYITSKPAASMLCALVCTTIIIGGTLASLEVQILIGHISGGSQTGSVFLDVELWRQQQKLFLSCDFWILSPFYFSRFSENSWDKHFHASPSFSAIIYLIMLLWNCWTTQNYSENCLLCLWLKCKKSLIFRCCPVCRESLFTPFFSEKRGFEAFSYLAWHYCEQRDSVRQSLKAGVTGLKQESPLRMSKLHFGVLDSTWNQLER